MLNSSTALAEIPPRKPQAGAATPSFLSSSRIAVMASLLGLYVLFGLLYNQVVVPIYAYGSFTYRPVALPVVQVGTVIVASLLLPTTLHKASDLFVWLCMLFVLLPAAVLSSHEGMDAEAMVLMFGAVALVKVLCVVFARFTSSPSASPDEQTTSRIAFVPLVGIHLAVLLALWLHVGGALSFSFQNVYDYRFDFNASLYFPLSYLLPFAAGPLAGIIAAVAVDRRNYVLLGLTVIVGLLFFGFSSHKALLFNPPFAAAGYFLIRSRYGVLIFMGIFAALSLLTLVFLSVAGDLLGASFANRTVFIPAQIHFYYFREFQELGFQYWAESRFGMGLMESRLPIDSVNYIGLLMAGDAAIGANTGWIANGYMNAGILGLVIYAFILAGLLHFLDLMGQRHGRALVGAAFLIPLMNIVNAMDLLAGFLTGGLFLALIAFAATAQRVSLAPRQVTTRGSND